MASGDAVKETIQYLLIVSSLVSALAIQIYLIWTAFLKWLCSTDQNREKIPIGPHKRAFIRRRRRKAVVLIVLLAMLAATTSITRWDKPEPKNEPSPSTIAYARNLYNMTGYNGEAKIYIDRWPEYAEEIMGK